MTSERGVGPAGAHPRRGRDASGARGTTANRRPLQRHLGAITSAPARRRLKPRREPHSEVEAVARVASGWDTAPAPLLKSQGESVARGSQRRPGGRRMLRSRAHLRPPRPRRVPGQWRRAEPPCDVPGEGRGGGPARASVRGARAPGVRALRGAGPRVCARPLQGLPTRPAGGLQLLSGAGDYEEFGAGTDG